MKNNKVLYIVIGICGLLVVGLCIFLMVNHKEEVVSDSEKFKADFEQYNGLTYEDTNESVIDVNIPEDNPFIYKTGKEIVDVLENEIAYVLFGYASCPLTRAAIEVLIETIEEAGVSKVYYVDIKDMRDEYVHTDSIIPEEVKTGTDAYYEILDFFGNNLEKYYVYDESGFYAYDTGVTRLKSPTFVAVSDGKVVSMHEELVASYDYSNRELTDEEMEELKKEYNEVLLAI